MGKVVTAIVAIAAVAAIIVFAPTLMPMLAQALGPMLASAVASMALSVALSVAISSVRSLVAGAPSAKAGGTPTVFRQTISDSFIIYGMRRVGGLLVFFHARQSGKDHFRYFVIACAGHRCQGVTRWFLGDEVVTVDGSGAVTSGKYAGAAWLWFQRGLASETANATFVSECGGRWTAAHKGNEVAAIYAKFKMTDAAVQAGMPNITAEVEGRDEIADPRNDSTGYTNNAALVFYDWMALPREEGGFGAYPDEIPDADWISAQANVCDEEVDGEARYAIDAVITTGAPPSEIRDVLTVNCAGSHTYSGGKFLMRPGYYVPVSKTLSEDDLAGPIQVSSFLGGDQSATEVQGTYIDPATGYQPAPLTTQSTGAADVRQLDVDLAFVTSKARGNRILSIMLKRAQAEKTVVWPMNIAGLGIRALDTVQFGTTRYGLSNYAFQVTGWNISSDFGIVISGREENEEIYGEPVVAAPAIVPTISKASPLLTERERQLLINGRRTVPTQVLSASESGGTVTVTMIAHDVVYPDGRTLSLEEQVFTTDSDGAALDPASAYYAHYADIDRTDTTPSVILTKNSDASTGVIGVHDLGRIVTPDAGSGIVYSGGGSLPPGQTIGREIELVVLP